jgi:hypothetical protein
VDANGVMVGWCYDDERAPQARIVLGPLEPQGTPPLGPFLFPGGYNVKDVPITDVTRM